MIEFSSGASHNKSIHFGDLNVLDGGTSMSVWFLTYLFAAPNTADYFISKLRPASDSAGWAARYGANTNIVWLHGDGASFIQAASPNNSAPINTLLAVGIRRDGLDVDFFINNVKSSTTIASGIQGNTWNVTLGNVDPGNSAQGRGIPGALGHVMIWHNTTLTDDEFDDLWRGKLVREDELDFRVKALYQYNQIQQHAGHEIKDLVSGTLGTYTNGSPGAIPMVSFAHVRDIHYRPATIPPQRALASFELAHRNKRSVYSIDVPLEFLALKNMDLVGLSHDSLPLTATELDGLEDHLLAGIWRRFRARVVGVTQRKGDRLVNLSLRDYVDASYWATDRKRDGYDGNDLDGTAHIREDSEDSNERASKAYIHQPALLNTGNSSGIAIATVRRHFNKTNSFGHLSEDGTTNPIVNSAFKNVSTGFDNWTSVENGGTIGVGSVGAYEDADVSNQSCFINGNGASSEPYVEQTGISVNSSDGHRRFVTYYSNATGTGNALWALQRASDSQWWNDANEQWQASLVWNTLTNNNQAINNPINRGISKPILADVTTTWNVRLGMDVGAAGNFFDSLMPPGRFVYSPIPTDTVAVTTLSDHRKVLRSSLPQLIPAERGTLTMRVQAEQEGPDLEDGDQMVLLQNRYGTSGDDFDVLMYEKLAGANVRFAFARYISGALDAKATKDVSITRGTIYKLAARWTSDLDGELELPARTLSLFVDGVKGTDAAASASHSSSEANTEIRRGWASDAGSGEPLVGLRAMNYVWDVHARPWVYPDEAIAAIG